MSQVSAEQPKGFGRPRKEVFSQEHQEILDKLQESAERVKGAKHALGHNPENRTDNQNDAVRLIENTYPDLYKAYQLKESLRIILHMQDSEQAADALADWMEDAQRSGLPVMGKLSEKIGRHRNNILNTIKCQANSAKSESTNTMIKGLIRLARGVP